MVKVGLTHTALYTHTNRPTPTIKPLSYVHVSLMVRRCGMLPRPMPVVRSACLVAAGLLLEDVYCVAVLHHQLLDRQHTYTTGTDIRLVKVSVVQGRPPMVVGATLNGELVTKITQSVNNADVHVPAQCCLHTILCCQMGTRLDTTLSYRGTLLATPSPISLLH